MQKPNLVPELSRRTFLLAGSAVGAVSVGPFAQAAAQTAAADAKLVQTSGYASSGRGAALYVHDSAVDGRYVDANPRSSFVTQDGRGFRLSLVHTITPYMFGTVGSSTYDGLDTDLTTDDTVALQAFFDFCNQNRVESANWGGVFGVTAELVMGGTFGDVLTQYTHTETTVYAGSIVLAVKSNINGAVLRVRSRRGATYGPITITHNKDETAWLNRRFDIGILVEDSAMFQAFSTVQVYQARVAGVAVVTEYVANRLEPSGVETFYSNTYHNSFESCHFENCGSGGLTADRYQATTFDTLTNEGSAENTSQRSRFHVGALPSKLAEGYGIPIFALIGPVFYSVRQITHATNFVRVHPWVDSTIGTSGNMLWVYGGGFVTLRGDTAITTGKVSGQNCSSGLVYGSLYNGYFTGTFQHNLIGATLGQGPDMTGLGGALNGYFEGNAVDILWNLTNANEDAYFTVSAEHALDPTKIRTTSAARRADNSMLKYPLYGLLVNNGGSGWQYLENFGDGKGNWTSAGIAFDRRNGDVPALHGDNPQITISGGGQFLYLYGYRARTIQVTGSGANKQPTGTLTITPPSTYKLNGGAAGVAATFTGFKGPVTVQASIDPADETNISVSVFSGYLSRATAQVDSTAPDIATLVTDFNALLAKLRAAGVIES